MKLIFQVICGLVLAISTSSATIEGTVGGGGEHSIDGLPVDISGVRTTGSAKLVSDPRSVFPYYNDDIVPILNRLRLLLSPQFATNLESVFLKRWYFSDEKLGTCTTGERLVDIAQQTRVCQNQTTLIVDRKWLMEDSFDAKGNRVPARLKQKITLIHEMLRKQAIDVATGPYSTVVDEDSLEYFVRLFCGYEGALPDSKTLAQRLLDAGFGNYALSGGESGVGVGN